MGTNVATMIVKLGADSYDFQSAITKAQRSTKDFAKTMSNLGQKMSLAITTPLAAIAATAVSNADTQMKAEAKVKQAIEATSGAAGLSFAELTKFASDLQDKTLFGDEQILNEATAQLLTFTNIAGDNFKLAQVAALDLSTLLDGDLKSASIQLGKALNDPVAGLSALSESGIQFSDDQKEVIKYLAETNRLAEAQAIILNEVERQYGGQAEAATTGTGSLKQLQNSWGDLLEDFGALIIPMLNKVVSALNDVVDYLSALDPATKNTILLFAGLAGVAGPLMMAISALVSPLGLALAGVVALGVAISAIIKSHKDAAKELANNNSLEELEQQLEDVKEKWDKLQPASPYLTMSTSMPYQDTNRKSVSEYAEQYKLLEDAIKYKTEALKEEEAAQEKSNQTLKEATNLIDEYLAAAKKYAQSKEELAATNAMPDGKSAYTYVKKASAAQRIETNFSFDEDAELKKMPASEYLENQYAALEEAKRRAEEFNNQVSALFSNTISTTIVDGITGIFSGDLGLEDIGKLIITQLADFLKQIGTALIEAGVLMLMFKTALESLLEMPGLAIAAGAAMVAAAALLQKSVTEEAETNIPALAQGGLAYGPTLAVVGDNFGASSDPEVIAPFSKISALMASARESRATNIRLSGNFGIKSRDLAYVLSQQNYKVSVMGG